MKGLGVDPFAGGYDQFVRARTPALLRSAYLLTGDQQQAENLVQAALARTHGAWSRLHQTGDAEAYTRQVMYRKQVSWWRRPAVAEPLTGLAHGWDPTDRIAVRAMLRQALLQLTPSQRAVLVLRVFEDRSEAETADVLDVSVGTVKSQTARALARLSTIAPELAELYPVDDPR
jgi:RNA polymerase sigma-70 factor (sigma-E family)